MSYRKVKAAVLMSGGEGVGRGGGRLRAGLPNAARASCWLEPLVRYANERWREAREDLHHIEQALLCYVMLCYVMHHIEQALVRRGPRT